MHIGLVLSSTPGYSETFFTSKIKGLIHSGFDVTLFCQADPSHFDLCNVRLLPKRSTNPFFQVLQLITVYFQLLFYLKKVKRFYELERQGGTSILKVLKKIYLNAPFFTIDLDWVHFGFATMALERELVPKAIGARLGVSFRGFDMAIYPIKHPQCYDLLWAHVDKIHTISDDLLALAYTYGLPKSVPFQKITPAVAVKAFQPLPDRDFKLDPISFLTVARLHWKKGLLDTLAALSLLKEEGIAFHYTIIGSGEQLEELQFAIYQYQLETHVTLTGSLSHDAVIDKMRSSTIYIQYSITEGFCNAVLEAQAMGLLCVVSDAEGLSENVLDGHTGWVISKRHPELLAKTLKKVITLPKATQLRYRQQAIKRVQDRFGLELQAQAFKAFYIH